MLGIRPYLEPSERIAEVLFGLIMVLTYTSSLSVARAGSADVHAMLVGALGCNLAWGVIDGIMYLMDRLAAQGDSIRQWRAMRRVSDPEAALRVIADVLPAGVADMLGAAELETMREKLARQPEKRRRHLPKEDWIAALSVALWVFLTTFPVAIPFIFIDDVVLALRVSNAIAIAMLFVTGYAFGRCSEYRPWLTGFGMVALGGLLVTFTLALGG